MSMPIGAMLRGLLGPWGEGSDMEFITETVLAAPAASVQLAAIPQTYRALVLFSSIRSDQVAPVEVTWIRFNADAGANYDTVQGYTGTGGTAGASARARNGGYGPVGETASSRANNWPICVTYIPEYTETDREKWYVCLTHGVYRNIAADADLYTYDSTGRWRNTAAITSITIVPDVGPNFVAGCRFALYGIT